VPEAYTGSEANRPDRPVMLSGVTVTVSLGMADRSAPEFMNAQALATHLGVTERTVRRWIERGELPADKHGRSFVIRREDGERLRLGGLGQVVDERSSLAHVLAERDRELAVLEGRYAELQEHNRNLEDVLHHERRRAALLEARLELLDGSSLAPRRAA
jgi:excisionase family DNA binding protein